MFKKLSANFKRLKFFAKIEQGFCENFEKLKDPVFNNKNRCTQGRSEEYSELLRYLFDKNVKGKKLPCFEVYSSQIEILSQPMDFYVAIIVDISSYKRN